MYNYMILNNYNVTFSLINASSVHVLGTPEELEDYISQNEKRY